MVKLSTAWVWPATDPLRTRRLRRPHRQTTFRLPMQDHGRPDDRTFRISWAGRSAQKTRRTNVQRKISISAFLLYALKLIHELPTPSNGGDTNITWGMPRMSTSLDIPLTRPLHTLETKGATYRHKALSKTGRTSKPYAPIATVFLFTRKIILNAPRVPSLNVCLLKEGIGGVRLQNLPQRRSCQVTQVNQMAQIATET